MVVSDGLVKGSHAVGVGGVDVEEGRAEQGRHDILVATTAGVAQGCVPVLTGERLISGAVANYDDKPYHRC